MEIHVEKQYSAQWHLLRMNADVEKAGVQLKNAQSNNIVDKAPSLPD